MKNAPFLLLTSSLFFLCSNAFAEQNVFRITPKSSLPEIKSTLLSATDSKDDDSEAEDETFEEVISHQVISASNHYPITMRAGNDAHSQVNVIDNQLSIRRNWSGWTDVSFITPETGRLTELTYDQNDRIVIEYDTYVAYSNNSNMNPYVSVGPFTFLGTAKNPYIYTEFGSTDISTLRDINTNYKMIYDNGTTKTFINGELVNQTEGLITPANGQSIRIRATSHTEIRVGNLSYTISRRP